MSSARRLAAIMFTDLVGSTASAQRDEKAALARQAEQETLLGPIFARHHGRAVKSTGDGFLVEFESALHAVESAVDVQRALSERNARTPEAALQVRIGIHLGDVEPRNGDLFGDAVNIASRIEPFAEPGGVCVSEPVFVQVRHKVPYPLEALGPRTLRGVQEPMGLYRVVVPGTVSSPAAVLPRLPRLAVLPFANISPDPDNAFFADGLTEELTTVLSQVKGLRVLSRTSVGQYRGTSKPVAQIGAELGADSVLEGSVRRAGDQLRISVQLIDTRTDEHRWAETYDRKLENIFAIQADVAERATQALRVELLRGERETIRERPTPDLRAYEAYLRGVQASLRVVGEFGDEASVATERWFEEAIRLDPNFAAAYSRLAGHLIREMGEVRSSAEVVPRIRALVARALELSPDAPESYVARGALAMQVDHDWARAEADFRRAIALNPNDADSRLHYCHLLSVLQRFEESRENNRVALELDPLNYLPRMLLAMVPANEGDLETAVREGRRLLESFPELPVSRAILGGFLAISGRPEEAMRVAAPLALRPELESREAHAIVFGLAHRPEPARELLNALASGVISKPLPLRYQAALRAVIGEDEAALELLERDAREGDDALWSAYQGPAYDRIRSDPRFVALLKAAHVPATLRRSKLFEPPPRNP